MAKIYLMEDLGGHGSVVVRLGRRKAATSLRKVLANPESTVLESGPLQSGPRGPAGLKHVMFVHSSGHEVFDLSN